MTTLLEKKNFLRVTNLKISCLSNLAILITPIVNALNILTCFKGFLNCLQLESFDNKGINVGRTCLNCIYIRISYFRNAYTRGAYTKSICTRNICITGDGIKGICIMDTYIRRVCIKNACIDSIYIKSAGIKGASIKKTLIKNIYARATYFSSVFTEASIYSNSVCIEITSIKGIGSTFLMNVSIGDTCI